MTTLHATFIGTATVLFEFRRANQVLRLLTDPVFDGPGASYRVGGVGALRYTSLGAPALRPEELPPIDAVLLSHDHHGDNLDSAGRRVAASAKQVLTTRAGATRLGRAGLQHVRGLDPWSTTEVRSEGAEPFVVRVTATPARHGPPLSLPLVGHVIGFLVEWANQERGPLWISGDTVWHRALEPIAAHNIDIAFLHVGAAAFGLAPGLRYTMNAADAVGAAKHLGARTICPIHFEGWSHFSEGRAQIATAFEVAGLGDRCVWLPPGSAFELTRLR